MRANIITISNGTVQASGGPNGASAIHANNRLTINGNASVTTIQNGCYGLSADTGSGLIEIKGNAFVEAKGDFYGGWESIRANSFSMTESAVVLAYNGFLIGGSGGIPHGGFTGGLVLDSGNEAWVKGSVSLPCDLAMPSVVYTMTLYDGQGVLNLNGHTLTLGLDSTPFIFDSDIKYGMICNGTVNKNGRDVRGLIDSSNDAGTTLHFGVTWNP
jgi:hypothetical protein